MNTGIADSMEIAANKTTLDRHVVNLFSHKAVLAVLMMYCVEEFQGFSVDYIMKKRCRWSSGKRNWRTNITCR